MVDDADPAICKFRAEMRKFYGDRLERLVLYGSRARGDGRPDSDYDIAVFLKDMNSRWDEIDPIIDIAHAITLDTGAVIHAMPFRAGSYADRTALMHELRNEGKDL